MANYYDEYKNDLYNPTDTHDEPGKNANWRDIQHGFYKVKGGMDALAGQLDTQGQTIAGLIETTEGHTEQIQAAETDIDRIDEELQTVSDDVKAQGLEIDDINTHIGTIDNEIGSINADIGELRPSEGMDYVETSSPLNATITRTYARGDDGVEGSLTTAVNGKNAEDIETREKSEVADDGTEITGLFTIEQAYQPEGASIPSSISASLGIAIPPNGEEPPRLIVKRKTVDGESGTGTSREHEFTLGKSEDTEMFVLTTNVPTFTYPAYGVWNRQVYTIPFGEKNFVGRRVFVDSISMVRIANQDVYMMVITANETVRAANTVTIAVDCYALSAGAVEHAMTDTRMRFPFSIFPPANVYNVDMPTE